MFKITHGTDQMFASAYKEAEKTFNRFKRRQYPCGTLTRMYCDFGSGYVLTRVGGQRVANALLPDHS